ncbi:hypothetical protein [Amycolatopsis suaedae]|uniref:Ig-like domain-containing protein n=1 Tax=Amycolatopsis suaedae TaxID=2510978 RepID=A0A4Q7J8R8_9PSEU|nr:hypothetical protein [Amycolatopsis suaedae]RZQ62773.1 hypothetical protein EWH70_17660 [Amycolatopsis suaedae]
MNITRITATGLLTGALLLAPAAALAQETSEPKPPPAPKLSVKVSPGTGKPGAAVTVTFNCQVPGQAWYSQVTSTAIDLKSAGTSDRASGTVKDVKPGKYSVDVTCSARNKPERKGSATFTVLGTEPAKPAKPQPGQVAKVPSGGVETGSGPADPSAYAGIVAALFGATTLAVAAGVGVYAYRRRKNDSNVH